MVEGRAPVADRLRRGRTLPYLSASHAPKHSTNSIGIIRLHNAATADSTFTHAYHAKANVDAGNPPMANSLHPAPRCRGLRGAVPAINCGSGRRRMRAQLGMVAGPSANRRRQVGTSSWALPLHIARSARPQDEPWTERGRDAV